jgi:MFS family permease
MRELFFETFSYFSPKKEHGLKTLYLALALLSLHWSLIVYINSSFLGQFISDASISMLFTFGSFISLFIFLKMPALLRKFGNYRLTILCTLCEIVAILGMALSDSMFFSVFFFLLHFVTVPLILLNLDVFIEKIVGSQEKKTGSMRGLYLTILSLASAIAPLFSAILIGGEIQSFSPAYIASAVMLIPFLGIIAFYFKDFKDSEYKLLSWRDLSHIFVSRTEIRNVFFVQIFLQLFFMWTILYIPLYMSTVAGFNWTQIGYILFAGLMAYVIFEYPIGVIADKYIGEKEMMAFGFFLIAVSVSWLAFLPSGAIGLWMIATFLTRTGASFAEATSESYFFKHTSGADADSISLFRMARPISAILGTVIGSIALVYVDFNMLFILLAFLMVPGIFFTLLLKDTK